MGQITGLVTETLTGLLQATGGITASIEEISRRERADPGPIDAGDITAGRPAPEDSGRPVRRRHPSLHVYCDRVVNLQREKFRKFSGRARVNVELRLSDERSEAVDRRVQLYMEAVTDVIERSRGDWGQGVSFGGSYEIQFEPIRHGGTNYIQTARVVLEVDVSQR